MDEFTSVPPTQFHRKLKLKYCENCFFVLTYCGMPYGETEFGQHWLR